MAGETFLSSIIVSKFVLPFLLIFFIVFALLEKTKILGEERKQLNALVAFVIGLIFVSAISPKLIVSNLILFLTVAIVVMFVGLILWGFATGGEAKIGGEKWVKYVGGGIVVVGVLIALIWATGYWNNFIDFFFKQDWSSSFWTNFLFIVVIAAALATAIKAGK